MIEAIVLDFGGVMTTSIGDAWRGFCGRQSIDESVVLKYLRGAYHSNDPENPLYAVEVGRITQTEFELQTNKFFETETGRSFPGLSIMQELFGDSKLEPAMVAAVASWRARGLKLGLCSNSLGSLDYTSEVNHLFDAVVLSGEIQSRKPDREIFDFTLTKLGVCAEKTVFIDDAKPNIRAAEAFGFIGILHTDPETTVRQVDELLGPPAGA